MEDFSGEHGVGLLGGTFNPVHLGHLRIASYAHDILKLEHLLFVPASTAPHKQRVEKLDDQHRLHMLSLAIAGNKHFGVCTMELDQGGVSYSVETIEKLAEQDKKAKFYLLIGSDSLENLSNWYRIDDIFELCQIAIFVRPGYENVDVMLARTSFSFERQVALRKYCFSQHPVDISSSSVRESVGCGNPICHMVPVQVERYIMDHHLYGC